MTSSYCMLGLFFSLIFAQVCFGDLYQYTDNEGVVHFTDNPGKVPAKFQKNKRPEPDASRPPKESNNRKFYSESNTSPKDSCQKPVMDSNCTTKVLRKYVPPECQNRPVPNGPPAYDAVCDKAINSSQARVELDQCITGWKIDAECKRLMEINGLYGR